MIMAIKFAKGSNKCKNKKATVDGIEFMSRKEAKRYIELKALEVQGKISNLELQKVYELIPAQREPDMVGKRGGIKKGKLIEHSCVYIADFVYVDSTGETIVEDVKGFRAPGSATYAKFVIKRKLMLAKYGIRIREV